MRVIDPDDFRDAREFKGWSQGQLGGLIGRSQQWVAMLEDGKVATVEPVTARLLADSLGLVKEKVFAHLSATRTPEESIGSRSDSEAS